MYLDKAREVREIITVVLDNPQDAGKTKKTFNGEVFEMWQDWQASQISHHGKLCCEIAREWITATDFSELGATSVFTGPRWLRRKFKWGASGFPIFWCETVYKKTLDCGALAALAHEIFMARGVKSYRAQMVQRFSADSTAQWANSWSNASTSLPWTNGDLIYHEGCAIVLPKNQELKIWDASAGWWIDPNSKDGYGSLLAVRISALNLALGVRFKWGEHHIKAFDWTKIN